MSHLSQVCRPQQQTSTHWHVNHQDQSKRQNKCSQLEPTDPARWWFPPECHAGWDTHLVSRKPFLFCTKHPLHWLHCSSLCCLFGRARRRCSFFWGTRRLAATPRSSSPERIRCWEWSLLAGTSGSCVSTHQVNKIRRNNECVVNTIQNTMKSVVLNLDCAVSVFVLLQIFQQGMLKWLYTATECRWARHSCSTTATWRKCPAFWRGRWTPWISCVR